ncbi:hypothetical protein CEXT_154561 [Caerostris extrusa]|uniref:Uncharacterized protein n=1 Tax=Caerostris extrusa TaxID=172846 RepID=A0AAV4M697_CAEEX|nr:hypothetical protein CEXT_154561 [Caerostris extrusa]
MSFCRRFPTSEPSATSWGELKLDNSLLTQLRGDNIKNMTYLFNLSFVNNSIEHVADDVFQGTEEVTSFDISHNLLTCLPPDSSSPGNAWRKCGSPTTSCCTWTTSFWNEPRGQLYFYESSLRCE